MEAEIKQIYNSAWSIGNDYIMKVGDDLPALKRNLTMMKLLDEFGIPVAHSIPTTDGKDYVEMDGKYFFLSNRLYGNHITDIYELDYVNIAYETGSIIARLHTALKACEKKINVWDNSLVEEMQGWIFDSLKTYEYRFITEVEYMICLSELQTFYNELPRQLIHRDIHYGNILFYQGEFSGYIDFDLSQKNVRVFDLCYFLLGLLIDHYKKEEDVQSWLTIVSKVLEGYEATNPLTNLEKDNICCIMCSIEILFIAFFMKTDNDGLAEGAAEMYHFIKNNEKRIRAAIAYEKNEITD